MNCFIGYQVGYELLMLLRVNSNFLNRILTPIKSILNSSKIKFNRNISYLHESQINWNLLDTEQTNNKKHQTYLCIEAYIFGGLCINCIKQT